MSRLKFPQKFLLISILFALPLCLTTFYFVSDINSNIDFAAKERLGVVYIHALIPLVEHLQTLRGTTYDQAAGVAHSVLETQDTSRRIALAIQGVDMADKTLGETLEAKTQWQTWKSNWMRFQQEAAGLTRQSRFDRSTELITQIIGLVSYVGDRSNLILDPDLDSYYLMESSVNRLLSVSESLGIMRGQHSAVQRAGTHFSEEKRLYLLGQATKEWEAIQRGLKVVYGANAPLKAKIEPQTQTLRQAFQVVSVQVANVPVQPFTSKSLIVQNQRLFSTYTHAIRAAFDEHALLTRILDSLLLRRIQGFETKRNRVLTVTCITITMVLYFLIGFYLSIRRMVDSLAMTTNRMLAGDKAELVALENRDEMAEVAASFNQVCLALQETATELQSNNDNLEHIVEERTRQMEHQAYHDALTDLPNRLFFLKELTAALKNRKQAASSIAVLFLDLDNFKTINDSLGHEAGDQMLQAVAQRLNECLRRDDIAARLGGDEFTVFLKDVKCVEDAVRFTERFIAALHKPIKLDKSEIFASGSIGIVFATGAEQNADELLRDADTAMYHAKGNGKSGYAVYDSTMSDKVIERMQLETALRFALERKEFIIHYQPLVNLQTGLLAGAEALIRWNHPQLGLLYPAKFLSIAEETGLIVPIGYWVLEEACRQTKLWKEQHPASSDFTINVNLSGRQLQREDVVARVRAVLEETGLDPALLKLEITESVMMKDIENAVAQLHALKALGILLAMDDFGTGYSSMASLNLFPLDTVKIDRSFVKRLTEQEQAVSMVAAIITLAHALHLDVTGEGIETEDHVSILQSMGCQLGQGYYFAKPMASTGLTNLMSSGLTRSIHSRDEAEREMIERLLRAA